MEVPILVQENECIYYKLVYRCSSHLLLFFVLSLAVTLLPYFADCITDALLDLNMFRIRLLRILRSKQCTTSRVEEETIRSHFKRHVDTYSWIFLDKVFLITDIKIFYFDFRVQLLHLRVSCDLLFPSRIILHLSGPTYSENEIQDIRIWSYLRPH